MEATNEIKRKIIEMAGYSLRSENGNYGSILYALLPGESVFFDNALEVDENPDIPHRQNYLGFFSSGQEMLDEVYETTLESIWLRHACPMDAIQSIAERGLNEGTYFCASGELADYYENAVCDEGHVAVTLAVRLRDLDSELISPDIPGIQEPITTVLGMSEDEVLEKWSATQKTWQDCLCLISSVEYKGKIPASDIFVMHEQEFVPITEYVSQNLNALGMSAE